MAIKQNGDKQASVTVTDKKGVAKTVIVDVEVQDGRLVMKLPSDIGIVNFP